MDNFDKDFDELLKNALDGDDDFNGLAVDEELIASTMKAIEEAAPMKEEIRASFDESFKEPQKAQKKSFLTKGNVIAIIGSLAAVAAVVAAFVFITGNKAFMSESTAVTTSASRDAGASAPAMAGTESNSFDAIEYKTETVQEAYDFTIAGSNGATYDSPESAAPALNEFYAVGGHGSSMTAPAEDGLYYFDDDEENFQDLGRSQLVDVYMITDKALYKPLLDAVKEGSEGEPEVSEVGKSGGSGDAGEAVAAGIEEDEAEEAAEEEEFDINNPAQLSEALADSRKMLEETGGGPSENAENIIDSIEVGGVMVPDFEYAPEKNPFWTEVGDSSDESFGEVAPLITIYVRDDDADLDVCVQVFSDKCQIYDFTSETVTIYTIKDATALAEELRMIAAQ